MTDQGGRHCAPTEAMGWMPVQGQLPLERDTEKNADRSASLSPGTQQALCCMRNDWTLVPLSPQTNELGSLSIALLL